MKPMTPDIDWDDILAKFDVYEGTIVSFCKKYKVSQHQLYYQRKKAKLTAPTFFPLTFETATEDFSITEALKCTNKVDKEITIDQSIDISIGKAILKLQPNNI